VAVEAQGEEDVRRLLTIPGVDVTTAETLLAVIGDVSRLPSSRQLVGCLGLHPHVRQSGAGPAHHGRLSKQGSAAARHVLVEAAWMAAASPGPLHAFAARIAARRGRQVAAVAVARKLSVLCWCLLKARRGLRLRPAQHGAPQAAPPRAHRRGAAAQERPARRSRLERDTDLAERRLVEQAKARL